MDAEASVARDPGWGLLSIVLAAQRELFLLTGGARLARRLVGLLISARDFLSDLVERRVRR